MRTSAAFAALVLCTLACAGAPAPESTDPQPEPVAPEPAAPAPRVLPEGDIEPVEMVTLRFDGKCHVELSTIPAAPQAREIGTIAGPCPSEAWVAWKEGAVVLMDEAGALTELGSKRALPAVPAPGGAVAFDSAGNLHACGPTEEVATVKDETFVIEFRGKTLEEGKSVLADSARVHLRWEIESGRWVEKGFALVPHIIFPGPPDCVDVPGFPGAGSPDDPLFADSDGPNWPASEWTTAHAEDATPLAAFKDGGWYTDSSRTMASQSQPGSGAYAAFIGTTWQLVYPGDDARGLWLTKDFIGIRDSSGGFRLLSRRDGAVAFEQADKTLSFPWPEGQSSGRPLMRPPMRPPRMGHNTEGAEARRARRVERGRAVAQPPICTVCPNHSGSSTARTRNPATSAREMLDGTGSILGVALYLPKAGPLVRRPGRAITQSRPLSRTSRSWTSWSTNAVLRTLSTTKTRRGHASRFRLSPVPSALSTARRLTPCALIAAITLAVPSEK